MASLGIPRNTIEVLQKYNFNFQKKFGQNFLIDTSVLDRIIAAAGITEEDCVLEVGPGIGTMTQYLAENAREVVAVEIDKNLIPILEDTLSEYDNVTVINDDILKVDVNRIVQEKNGGLVKTMWCGDVECEQKMKEVAGMSSRCIPFAQEHLADTCPCCGRPAQKMVYWGVAY